MSGMPDPSTYSERTSAVAGVTVWTRVTDGSTSWILPDGCIDVLWNGRELTVAGPDRRPISPTRQPARATRRCASRRVWRLPCSVWPRSLRRWASAYASSTAARSPRSAMGPRCSRVLRLQRALSAARCGMPLVEAALAAGYADQAHFAHEVSALTSESASQLVGSAAKGSTPLPSGSRSVA